jgi:DUF1680 family protein
MKDYPAQLLIVLSLNHLIPPPLVMQSNHKVSQQLAVERFFTTNRLSPDWFSPGTLKINNLSELQKKRDDLKARIKQKYGKYQRVELIVKNRYRIIFENANPDMIVGTFKFDWMDRIYEIEMQLDSRFIDSLNSSVQIN